MVGGGVAGVVGVVCAKSAADGVSARIAASTMGFIVMVVSPLYFFERLFWTFFYFSLRAARSTMPLS
jgi:uncharacterized membrane protein YqgA involved in biofilm formation